MRALVTAVATFSFLVIPAAAFAGTTTVTDDVGEINTGPEISDISAATVTYSARRLTIRVTHAWWSSAVGSHRAATGGLVTFDKGGTFVILSNADGRRSLLHRKQALLNCPDGKSCALPCSGWRYKVDSASTTTSVSVPVRCFGFDRAPQRVKVLPLHMLPYPGQQPVYDPVARTGWITRA